MSEIVFSQRYVYRPDKEIIEFPAIVDGKTVVNQITMAEMSYELSPDVNAKTFEEEFLRLRPTIDERAKKQILAKQAEKQS